MAIKSPGSAVDRLILESREKAAIAPSRPPKMTLNSLTFQSDMELRKRYENLISKGNKHPEKLEENLAELRKMILLEGLPPETEEEQTRYETEGTLRGKIWQILLRVRNFDANKYIALVEKGKADDSYQQIRSDTFRTFKTSLDYTARVPEEKLIRLLNAFIHSCNDKGYVQGMNVVCAPFLYVMPELDAFYTFCQLMKVHCPTYYSNGIEGSYTALKLVDEILKLVDPELFAYLISKNMKADCYAMPLVMTFSACTPPLEELLRLWDFYFAFGVHLNIVCAVAQIVCMREELLNSEQPGTMLRTLPPLDSNLIISVAVQLVRQLPEDLYHQLVTHPIQRKYNTLPKNLKLAANQSLDYL